MVVNPLSAGSTPVGRVPFGASPAATQGSPGSLILDLQDEDAHAAGVPRRPPVLSLQHAHSSRILGELTPLANAPVVDFTPMAGATPLPSGGPRTLPRLQITPKAPPTDAPQLQVYLQPLNPKPSTLDLIWKLPGNEVYYTACSLLVM